MEIRQFAGVTVFKEKPLATQLKTPILTTLTLYEKSLCKNQRMAYCKNASDCWTVLGVVDIVVSFTPPLC